MNTVRATTALLLFAAAAQAQVKWENVDAEFGDLPEGFHVYKTTDPLNGKPNIAYYVSADLRNKHLRFDVDTTLNRRLTPSEFHEKNRQPLLVVNTTFFSFQTNQSLNTVIKNGKQVAHTIHNFPGKGKDTLTYKHPVGSAIGITQKGKADIAWVFSDSSKRYAFATQNPVTPVKDSSYTSRFSAWKRSHSEHNPSIKTRFRPWKMKTAVGGGPVLVQNGTIRITNNEEMKFAGKGLNDKHPRTAMGYTADGKLIIMAIQGRMPGKAEGADLEQEARMLMEIGCVEALNLDGGGSSCLLVNGKETIQPSDKNGVQRPVPAVFLINRK